MCGRRKSITKGNGRCGRKTGMLPKHLRPKRVKGFRQRSLVNSTPLKVISRQKSSRFTSKWCTLKVLYGWWSKVRFSVSLTRSESRFGCRKDVTRVILQQMLKVGVLNIVLGTCIDRFEHTVTF